MFMNYRWSDEKPYSLKYSIQFYTHTYINLLIAKLCSVVSCMKVNFYPEAEILLPRERGPPKNFPCVLLNVTPLKHIVPRTNLFVCLFVCLGGRQGEADKLNCNPLQRVGVPFFRDSVQENFYCSSTLNFLRVISRWNSIEFHILGENFDILCDFLGQRYQIWTHFYKINYFENI